jgi:enolase
MKITRVVGREIFDSRGLPTVECQIFLDDNLSVSASVPSGKSRGIYEAVELRDGGSRLAGMGVRNAIENLEKIIGPALIGKEPDVIALDRLIGELDTTPDKSKLGANATLAASIAVCKAQALVNEMEVYEFIAYLCNYESVTLPYPMFNIINGGVHADNKLSIQEFLMVPVGAESFRGSVEMAMSVSYELKNLLRKYNKKVFVGDEGGFAADFKDEREALDILMESMDLAGIKEGEIVLALDVAASEFYDFEKRHYQWQGQLVSSDAMLDFYQGLINQYPIYSIEDGFSYDDVEGWKKMMQLLGGRIQIVGDDLFATNPARLIPGIEGGLANATVVKPNQIGTVTETLQVVKMCKEVGVHTVISHRSGETEDTFIVDLVVGTSAGQLKAGGCARGECIAKYNQCLRIEDALLIKILGS